MNRRILAVSMTGPAFRCPPVEVSHAPEHRGWSLTWAAKRAAAKRFLSRFGRRRLGGVRRRLNLLSTDRSAGGDR